MKDLIQISILRCESRGDNPQNWKVLREELEIHGPVTVDRRVWLGKGETEIGVFGITLVVDDIPLKDVVHLLPSSLEKGPKGRI